MKVAFVVERIIVTPVEVTLKDHNGKLKQGQIFEPFYIKSFDTYEKAESFIEATSEEGEMYSIRKIFQK